MLVKLVVNFVVCYLSIFTIKRAQALSVVGRIINGNRVGAPTIRDPQSGQYLYVPDTLFPYMVSLQHDGYHICGGAILHESVVITAAHCLEERKISTLSIRAGVVYTNGTRFPQQESKISKISFHPDYIKVVQYENFKYAHKYMEYDVALLFLETPLRLNAYVDKINIEYQKPSSYIGETLTALGFGYDYTGDPNGRMEDGVLKKADLTVLTDEKCVERAKPYGPHKNMLCAADMDDIQAICHADSGSPFVRHYPREIGKDVLIGIASWGTGCEPKRVSGFTSLYYAEAFIKRELYNNHISI